MRYNARRLLRRARAPRALATYRVPPESLDELRTLLFQRAYTFEDRPHQRFLARLGKTVVNAYTSGSVVVTGASPPSADVLAWLDEHDEAVPEKYPMPEVPFPHAGTDETGKGDYFGPLVVAGVVVDAREARELAAMGARDSKRLDDEQSLVLSERIQRALPRSAWKVLRLAPETYNAMHRDGGNANHILAWAHARVLEDLARANPACSVAVVDRFAHESTLTRALGEPFRAWRIVQVPHGERDVAVAAASILARAEFLLEMRLLSARYDMRLPLGATHVEDAARRFVARHGADELGRVAKVHFRTTGRVLGSEG